MGILVGSITRSNVNITSRDYYYSKEH